MKITNGIPSRMNCVIIDDDIPARRRLEAYINRLDLLNLAGQYRHANEAMEIITNKQADLVFIDMKTTADAGLQLAEKISANRFLTVLLTAHKAQAHENNGLHAFDFLSKPVSFERLKKITDKAYKTLYPAPSAGDVSGSFFVRCEGKLEKIRTSEIVYLSSLQNYYRIHLLSGKVLLVHAPLKKIYEKLDKDQFVMIHKSFIVNLEFISSIYGEAVQIEGFGKIPIGRVFKNALLEKINL